jgi:hypothetical protein
MDKKRLTTALTPFQDANIIGRRYANLLIQMETIGSGISAAITTTTNQ